MTYGPRTDAVYRWELDNVDRYDRTCLQERQINAIVQHVWASYGLRNPPLVKFRDAAWSSGRRSELTFSRRVNTVTVLHEVCHAMDMSLEFEAGIRDERTREYYDEDAHGPNWLGLYVNALDKFMPQPELKKLFLMNSLARAGLDFHYAPRLRCL